MKIGDRVIHPGCGGVGKVLRVRTYHDDEDEDENGRFQLFVQWPDSGTLMPEYVKPCWDDASNLRLAPGTPEADEAYDEFLDDATHAVHNMWPEVLTSEELNALNDVLTAFFDGKKRQ